MGSGPAGRSMDGSGPRAGRTESPPARRAVRLGRSRAGRAPRSRSRIQSAPGRLLHVLGHAPSGGPHLRTTLTALGVATVRDCTALAEHAVIAHLRLSESGFGTPADRQRIAELEE